MFVRFQYQKIIHLNSSVDSEVMTYLQVFSSFKDAITLRIELAEQIFHNSAMQIPKRVYSSVANQRAFPCGYTAQCKEGSVPDPMEENNLKTFGMSAPSPTSLHDVTQ